MASETEDRIHPFEVGPYNGQRVYYSGSIHGAPTDQNFAWELVRFIANGGADVLSEHVAARTPDEMDTVRARRLGMAVQEMLAYPDPSALIRENDVKWVNEATHVVAVVDAPSFGVGMEIERAILKPQLGLNTTPILCLVHADKLSGLSNMILGVRATECPVFYLRTYTTLEEAQQIIHEFLTGQLTQEGTA